MQNILESFLPSEAITQAVPERKRGSLSLQNLQTKTLERQTEAKQKEA